MTAGYSGAPLARKLGITEGARVGSYGAPEHFPALLEPVPPGVELVEEPDAPCDVLLAFAVDIGDLTSRFASALQVLPAAGGLWVAWPKRSSGVTTTLNFDIVQDHGLTAGLVDNKVCAMDATWSGLRFVVRKEDRATWPR